MQRRIAIPAAKQLHRVPSANASDLDVCKLSDAVDAVRAKLENMQKVLKSVSDNQASLTDTVNLALSTRSINVQKIPLNIPVSRDTVTDGACDTNGGETGDSDKVDDVAVANVAGSSMLLKSFADMFGHSQEDGEWFPAARAVKKQQAKATRKIVGANDATNLKVKAIASSSEWHIFAGRLCPTTTEGDLSAMLSDQGIKVVSCQLLPKTADWQHKFAAFHVVVDARDKDDVFNDTYWPVGADVRDWWFKIC